MGFSRQEYWSGVPLPSKEAKFGTEWTPRVIILLPNSQVVLVVKNLPANAGDLRDTGSIPRLERSPGGGHGNPLQYSCLENPHGQRSLEDYGS